MRVPTKILKAAGIASLAGLAVVYASKYIHHKENQFPWNEVVRDFGIALIVAGVVSVVYEWSTRSAEKREHMKQVLDETLSAFIPMALWQEVQSEVLHRQVFRTNMVMDIVVYEKQYNDCVTTETKQIPSNLLVFQIKISYEIKGIRRGKTKAEITQVLDQHMFNPTLGIPKFISANIIDTDEKNIDYIGENLKPIIKEGVLTLSNANSVKVSFDGKPAKIVSDRYELVTNPGLYTLILPDMVIPEDSKPSITLSIDTNNVVNKNLYFNPQTWFNSSNHDFKKDSTDGKWKFGGVMLPGQGFSIEIGEKKGGS